MYSRSGLSLQLRKRSIKKVQAPKRPHKFVIKRIKPQNTSLRIYNDSAACDLNEIRRDPSNQIVRLHLTARTILIREGSQIANHPYPSVIRRDVIDIKEPI